MQIKLWPENEKRLVQQAYDNHRTPTMEANVVLEEWLKPIPKVEKKKKIAK